MLFFSGFGSMFPYLIYLSVVWICVLVGLRGNIGSLFQNGRGTELVAETSSEKNFIHENTIAPFRIEQNTEKADWGTEFHLIKLFTLNNSIVHRNYLFKHPNSQPGKLNISRRGPPILV